jgi:hypothetical protein
MHVVSAIWHCVQTCVRVLCVRARYPEREGGVDVKSTLFVDPHARRMCVTKPQTTTQADRVGGGGTSDSHLQAVVSNLERFDKNNLRLGNGIAFNYLAIWTLDQLVTQVVLHTVRVTHAPDHVEGRRT